MEQSLSDLHPNPGWGDTEIQPTDMVGKHCILELYDCEPIRLNDEAFLRTTLTTAAKEAGIKRVVYTSSIAAVGNTPKGREKTESDWQTDRFSPYTIAKTDSEKWKNYWEEQFTNPSTEAADYN